MSIAQMFASVPGGQLNHDGSAGISVHVDLGVTAPECAGTTICGNWGGFTESPLELESATISSQSIRDNLLMAPVRWGVYHYGYVGLPTSGSCGAAGSAQPWGMAFWHCVEGNVSTKVMAHELGHNFGLDHHGEMGEPVEQLNHKLNYRSVMNYEYLGTGWGPYSPGFSAGNQTQIDNFALDEENWSSTITNLPYQWQPHYAGADGLQPLIKFPDGSANIDWNLDRRITAGGVRFDVSPGGLTPGGDWEANFGISSMGSDPSVPDGGLALTLVDGQLYAFARVAGTLRYRSENPAGGGWSAWSFLDQSWIAADGDTAIGTILMGGTPRVLVVHPGPGSQLYYALFNPATQQVVEDGPVPGWPLGATAENASMAQVGNELAIAFRDEGTAGSGNNGVWYARVSVDHNSLVFSSWNILMSGSSPLSSKSTPAIVFAPDDKEYFITSGNGSLLAVYDRWANQPLASLSYAHLIVWRPENTDDNTRVNGLFLPYLTAAGSPFADNSGYLAVYANSGANEWARSYSGPIGPTIGPDRFPITGLTAARGLENLPATRVRAEHSVAAVAVGGRAIMAFTRQDLLGSLWLNASPSEVAYANGLAPVTSKHTDYRDTPKLQEYMCSSLWKILPCNQKCINPLWSGSCSSTEPEMVVCDGQAP